MGSDKDIAVDVRVVAATNKDLKTAMATGEFREDLYHRLAVVPIHVAPLAERSGDIPLLVDHFLDVLCAQAGRPVPEVTEDAMKALLSAPWTGNVRELRNAVERLLIFCPKGEKIDGKRVEEYGQLRG